MIDLIADPVRLRIVRHLAERGSASLSELAAAAGVHVNTARPHLAELESGGLLTSATRAPSGPGRPAVDYRLNEGWTFSPSDYLPLAELLATALVRRGASPAELRSMGQEWGRYAVGRPGVHDVASELPRVLGHLGYEVDMQNGTTARLSGCPCPLVAPDRPSLICAMAKGVAEGVIAASGSPLRLAGSQHDSERRRCAMQLSSRSGGPRSGTR
jgi:predicted ArsR family transcriptional regulator